MVPILTASEIYPPRRTTISLDCGEVDNGYDLERVAFGGHVL